MKKKEKESLPFKLRQLRQRCGYSQETLAEVWSTSQPTVSNIELERSELTFVRVEQVARFYKLSIDELLREDIRSLLLKIIERQPN